MKILGIETSCDETAAAIVEDGNRLLSSVVASSIDLHKVYGGVVPEIAARSHIEAINPVIEQALAEADCSWDDIDSIAVTYGPGLGGSLLIGVLTARSLAIVKNKPLFPVNHVEAHVYASFIDSAAPSLASSYQFPASRPEFPLLALIVSGGHTQLVLFENYFNYTVLGKTLDDAVGEAFDKIAKMLGLPYPGGPSIEQAAENGNEQTYDLPKPKTKDKYGFSYSGLKTAVLRTTQKTVGQTHQFPSHQLSDLLSTRQKNDLAASFQAAALNQLVDKTSLACQEFNPKSIVVAGGVAASSKLRELISHNLPVEPIYPDIKLCTDNAAMIASHGCYQQIHDVKSTNPYTLEINPSLSM
jgi:N6-L-threonylcarbamoyladenine synthase